MLFSPIVESDQIMDSWHSLLILIENSFERFLDRLVPVEGDHVRQILTVDNFLYHPEVIASRIQPRFRLPF